MFYYFFFEKNLGFVYEIKKLCPQNVIIEWPLLNNICYHADKLQKEEFFSILST